MTYDFLFTFGMGFLAGLVVGYCWTRIRQINRELADLDQQIKDRDT